MTCIVTESFCSVVACFVSLIIHRVIHTFPSIHRTSILSLHFIVPKEAPVRTKIWKLFPLSPSSFHQQFIKKWTLIVPKEAPGNFPLSPASFHQKFIKKNGL